MKREKPLILLSNDDGVEAKGLNELIRGLRGVGEMIVMAPDGPRSGASGRSLPNILCGITRYVKRRT